LESKPAGRKPIPMPVPMPPSSAAEAPSHLSSRPLTLRRANPSDEPLLFALFAEEKAAHFAALGLAQSQLGPLLEMQYRARRIGYQSSFPNATQWVIVDPVACPVGQLLRNDEPQIIHLMDISLVPSVRARGIGTQILSALQGEAARAGKRIDLQVATASPARRLYLRLGFATQSGDSVTERMIWSSTELPTPIAAQPTSSPART
jgi:ribosomal protein S18 acetylase RimI-like enzyme